MLCDCCGEKEAVTIDFREGVYCKDQTDKFRVCQDCGWLWDRDFKRRIRKKERGELKNGN